MYLQWKALGQAGSDTLCQLDPIFVHFQAFKAFLFFTLIFVPAIAGLSQTATWLAASTGFIVVSSALFGKYIFGQGPRRG